MLDIHAHIIPYIDDGCESMEQAIEMLERAIANGVTHLFCTPHYRGKFNKTAEEVVPAFNQLCEQVKEKNLPISLYLGQEISCKEDYAQLLKDEKLLSMNGTKYVLLELDLFNDCEANEVVYSLAVKGYKPIVAHLERYPYIDLHEAYEIKNVGGLIQINADSIAGVGKRANWSFVKKLFKNGLVDFVASDSHYHRENVMANARKIVEKKFGSDCAKVVFEMNKRVLCK